MSQLALYHQKSIGRKKEKPRPEEEYNAIICRIRQARQANNQTPNSFSVDDCQAMIRIKAVQRHFGPYRDEAKAARQKELDAGYCVLSLDQLHRCIHEDPSVPLTGLRHGNNKDTGVPIIPIEAYWGIVDEILEKQPTKYMALHPLLEEAGKKGYMNVSLLEYVLPTKPCPDLHELTRRPAPIVAPAPVPAPAPAPPAGGKFEISINTDGASLSGATIHIGHIGNNYTNTTNNATNNAYGGNGGGGSGNNNSENAARAGSSHKEEIAKLIEDLAAENRQLHSKGIAESRQGKEDIIAESRDLHNKGTEKIISGVVTATAKKADRRRGYESPGSVRRNMAEEWDDEEQPQVPVPPYVPSPQVAPGVPSVTVTEDHSYIQDNFDSILAKVENVPGHEKEIQEIKELREMAASNPSLYPRVMKLSSLKDFAPILTCALGGDATGQPMVVDEHGNPFRLGDGMLYYRTEDGYDIIVFFSMNEFCEHFENSQRDPEDWDNCGPSALLMKRCIVEISGADDQDAELVIATRMPSKSSLIMSVFAADVIPKTPLVQSISVQKFENEGLMECFFSVESISPLVTASHVSKVSFANFLFQDDQLDALSESTATLFFQSCSLNEGKAQSLLHDSRAKLSLCFKDSKIPFQLLARGASDIKSLCLLDSSHHPIEVEGENQMYLSQILYQAIADGHQIQLRQGEQGHCVGPDDAEFCFDKTSCDNELKQSREHGMAIRWYACQLAGDGASTDAINTLLKEALVSSMENQESRRSVDSQLYLTEILGRLPGIGILHNETEDATQLADVLEAFRTAHGMVEPATNPIQEAVSVAESVDENESWVVGRRGAGVFALDSRVRTTEADGVSRDGTIVEPWRKGLKQVWVLFDGENDKRKKSKKKLNPLHRQEETV